MSPDAAPELPDLRAGPHVASRPWRVWIVGGCVAWVVILLMIPGFLEMQRKAMDAELPSNLDGLLTMELVRDAAYDGFVACGSREEALAWARGREADGALPEVPRPTADCLAGIGFRPREEIAAYFWVEVEADDLAVKAIAWKDGRLVEHIHDGDGQRETRVVSELGG